MRLANEIREHGSSVICSACSGQEPELRYVDFDAACDRGYGPDGKTSLDDLILCERCVRSAGLIVDMADSTEMERRVAHLEEKAETYRKAYEQARTYSERLEAAFDARPQPVKFDHRRKPRKELAVNGV